jgi:hypothetical protein
MRPAIFVTLLLAIACGCAQTRLQADLAENDFAAISAFADAGAGYVGEWTATTSIGTRSVKIREDGLVKVCLAGSGATDGKIYLDNGVPTLMLKSGARVKFIEVNRDFLLLNIYGSEEKYYSGQVGGMCRSAFDNFR